MKKSLIDKIIEEIKTDSFFEKFKYNLKSASNLNGNLNGSKELEHYAS